MGKNQSASGLTNIIQYDNNGNVSFVSGSTTLMQISSSGAITTTGVISGSNALSASFSLNSGLLNETGSVGFTTTSSFLAVSSSQQQISASYIALSASYNTFSGSASTRITENSSSIQQVSSSQQQISASLLNVISIFATTGSNSFRATQSITGSLTVTGQIIAQTLNVQQVTSSIIYSSGSNNFGCDLNSRQTFTGSVLITGSLTIAAGGNASAPIIFGSTISCSPIGCFATSCATSFIGGTFSGTTIYGSTAVCSPVGKFITCIDAGSATFSGLLTINVPTDNTTVGIFHAGGGTANRGLKISTFASVNDNAGVRLDAQTTVGGATLALATAGVDRLTIASTGAATFTGEVNVTSGLLSISGSGGTPPTSGVGLRYVSNRLLIYGGSSDITFQKNSNAGANMMILENGNVGIGTSSPSGAAGVALAINGGANQTRIALKNSTTGDGAGNGFQILLEQGGLDAKLEQRENAALSFATNTTERMRITSAGIACFTCQVCAPIGVFSAAPNTINTRFNAFATGDVGGGASCLVFTDSLITRGLYLISIGSSVDSTFGYSGFLWVTSGGISIANTIRQSCVSLSFSGRNICAINQYTAETAVLNISLTHINS